uniref:Ion transport domain-containing protein n=1 Tax=Gasterosteus aculeatus aculeatus TaxID=481459 RepID=G3NXF0_GASAC
MASRKMTFFEMWRSKKERGELRRRTNQLRLDPSQMSQLLGDTGVRRALQNSRIEGLLPPIGMEVFRRLTPASLRWIEQPHEAEEMALEMSERSEEVTENNMPKQTSDLETGKPLPIFFGDPSHDLLNTPLEELDPFYESQKTFIVVNKDNIVHRFNAEQACYLLSPFNPLRTAAIRIYLHSLFNFFILVTILTNCVLMTMSDPPAWFKVAERVFTTIYMFEVIIKVVSRGFCFGKFTFLRDPWNWLDGMVISTGFLMEFIDFGKVSVLATVPRVLKIFAVIPGLKTSVGALVRSLKRLLNVIVLMLLCLSVLALIGLLLFVGDLKRKCVIWPSYEIDNYTDYLQDHVNYYYRSGSLDALLCGNTSDSGRCPEGYTCLKAGNNPNYGYTSFDSFGWSLLSVVRLMSKDYWENLVEMTLRAAGKRFLTFFMLVVFPGCFHVLSLAVAVVAMACCEQEEAAVGQLKQREGEFGQILEAIKRSEEDEGASRAALSPEPEKKESVEGPDRDQRACSPCKSADCLLKWNCCGCCRWIKQRLNIFISSPFFDLGVVICLVLNIIFMCMEHYPMTERFSRVLNEAHLVFTLIFAAEMFLKLIAMNLDGYFRVGWNIFDSLLVAISLLELLIVEHLPCVLMMRVFRLAKWWPSFRMLIKLIWTSVRALWDLTLVLLIMVFMFSVVGMQLFQQDYKDNVCRISVDCHLPRWHFNSFFHSVHVIIRVLFGEWIEVTWDCMEVSSRTTCLIFFLMVVVIGNLLLLNLFVTLLLSSFITEAEEKNNLQIVITRINRTLGNLLRKKTQLNPDQADNEKVPRKKYLDSAASHELVLEVQDRGHLTSESCRAPTAEAEETAEDDEETEIKRYPEDSKEQNGDTPKDCCSNDGTGRVWSNLRRACFSIVQHKCFEYILLIIILLSSVALAFEDIHLQHRQVLKTVVARAEQVFTCLFLVEMILKWIAFGLKKYFTSTWTWIDFLILQVSVVSLAADRFGFSELGVFQSFRTLRALGLLRAVSRVQGLKVVVQALVRTVQSMFDLLLVVLVFWLAFSILGVNLFGGKFHYCSNETSQEIISSLYIANKSECLLLSMEEDSPDILWKSTELNYDNVLSGYLSLLHLGLSADCVDVMYAAVDATWLESQPVFEYNSYMYLYFICFIIGSFFTLNLFIRAVIDNLHRQKSSGNQIFITKEQHKYCMFVKTHMMKPQEPFPRPQNCCQARLFDLLTKRPFQVLMAVVVFLNMVTLMVVTDQETMEYEEVLPWLHLVFLIIYTIEFILKLIGLRHHYFTSGWNILDFVVLIFCIVGIFIGELFFYSPLFTVLRVVHIFRILSWVTGIRKLLNAFMMSLPALFNIGLLYVILMFISSLFGMLNFGYVKKDVRMDDMFNFETFGSSVICLLMITTSASWGGFLTPIMSTQPDCDPDMGNPGSTTRGNCGSPAVAIVFFITHICLTFLLVVCLYLTIILETFKSEDGEPLSEDDFQMFYKTWKKFDPEASQFIRYSELSDFCDALQEPLKIPKTSSIKLTLTDLPLLSEDKVHCSEVLHALTTQVLGDLGMNSMNSIKARLEEKFMTNSFKVSCEPISSSLQGKQEDVEATILQQRADEETAVQSVQGGVSASE